MKRIALVADNLQNKKLLKWVEQNYKKLITHQLISIGALVEQAINKKLSKLERIQFKVEMFKPEALGGMQQFGSRIIDNQIDLLMFFWDPMQPQTHDVQALLRVANLYNVPTANNLSIADYLILSPILDGQYRSTFKNKFFNITQRLVSFV